MLAVLRNKRAMDSARDFIRYYTNGEEAERARYLRSDERLRARFAQLDELRARREELRHELARFNDDGAQT